MAFPGIVPYSFRAITATIKFMIRTDPTGPTFIDRAPEAWRSYMATWARRLAYQSRRPGTIETYGKSVVLLAAWVGKGPDDVTSHDVEAWFLSMTGTGNTRLTRYKAVRAFWRFLTDEGLAEANPTDSLPLPRVMDEGIPDVLSPAATQALTLACAGNDFYTTRDGALIRFLLESGARVGECLSVRTDRIDLEAYSALVEAKGGGTREVRFGHDAAWLIDRYLLRRAKHENRRLPQLWIGKYGPLGRDGVNTMLKARAKQAGLDPTTIHAHVFRHSWAHANKVAGLSDESLRSLGGWSDKSSIPLKYGRKLRADRAAEEQTRLDPFKGY